MSEFNLTCPAPHAPPGHITMAHGGGGRASQQLVENVFRRVFSNATLNTQHDGALLAVAGKRLAFSTDSYVVRPLFFPGGDIGTLAINGTVNDLAMCGARPRFMSVGFIIEEGFEIAGLERIAQSMASAADAAGIQVVTGDTKVVDRGKGDGVYINTAGVGIIESDHIIGPASVQPGDAILLSGDLGRHGIAVMAEREGLAFESTIESDCAPLHAVVLELLRDQVEVHCLRDLTRGGLASGLVEIAEAGQVPLLIEEMAIPVGEAVRGACEILGLDPFYVANEGRFIAFVAPHDAERACAIMRRHPVAAAACRIGTAAGPHRGTVTLASRLGARRILDMLNGEQLPRIC